MQRTARKLTQADFHQRIQRLDSPVYKAAIYHRPDTQKSHGFAMGVLGFVWVYLLVMVSTNRPFIEASMQGSNLSLEYYNWILGGLVVFLAASFSILGLHLVRYVVQKGAKRRNSGGLLCGALIAGILIYTPPSVWQTGYSLLDENTQSLIANAGVTLDREMDDLNISSISFVTSLGD